MKLNGKVAIITGAGSGIGRASAQLFAREGARIVVVDKKDVEGQETVKSIEDADGQAVFKHADVSDLGQLKEMVASAIECYGRLDILFSNAGVPGALGFEEITEAEWDEAVSVNLKAAFFGAKFAAREMMKAGAGSIIFTSSAAGLVGSARSPIYSATKGGVRLLSQALARRLAPCHIRVNTICPGPIETPMLTQAFVDREAHLNREALAASMAVIPLGRPGKAEEVANTALFLASDDSSFITGVDITVDGGYRS